MTTNGNATKVSDAVRAQVTMVWATWTRKPDAPTHTLLHHLDLIEQIGMAIPHFEQPGLCDQQTLTRSDVIEVTGGGPAGVRYNLSTGGLSGSR